MQGSGAAPKRGCIEEVLRAIDKHWAVIGAGSMRQTERQLLPALIAISVLVVVFANRTMPSCTDLSSQEIGFLAALWNSCCPEAHEQRFFTS